MVAKKWKISFFFLKNPGYIGKAKVFYSLIDRHVSLPKFAAILSAYFPFPLSSISPFQVSRTGCLCKCMCAHNIRFNKKPVCLNPFYSSALFSSSSSIPLALHIVSLCHPFILIIFRSHARVHYTMSYLYIRLSVE